MTSFTTRQALVDDQVAHPPYGSRVRASIEQCIQVSSTAGTTGPVLRWLFSRADVVYRARLWQAAFEANGVHSLDRALLDAHAWGCRGGLENLGVLCIAAPDELVARARALIDHEVTVLVGTPSDALRIAAAAHAHRIDLVESAVRFVVVTGEPGGHVASTRRRIEEAFGARCMDVYWLTECGVVGWDCAAQDVALHLNEEAFDVEVDDGELVLSAHGPSVIPLERYRTGDVASLESGECPCGRSFVRAVGGVLGRVHERLQVRGIEMLPSSVENVVRRHPAVCEYQLAVYHVRGECELAIEIEPDEAVASEGDRARVAAEVAEDLRRSLGIRLQCEAVPPRSVSRNGSRPRRLHVRN